MKIQQIQIDGFGKWQDQSFDIDSNLQIVYGQNEAGKTTLNHFITSVLFGFANGHQQYQQYLPKNGAAYGGQLTINADDQVYRLQRTKGKNGGTLKITDEQGQPVSTEQLTQILGPIDQELYAAIFNFSQTDLNMIFNLSREDLLTHLQRVGAVGSSQWLGLIKEHDKTADEIYKPKGRKPALNIRLKEYEQLTQQVHQAAGQYDHYQDLLVQVGEQADELRKRQQKLTEVQAKLEHVQELNRLMPTFMKLKSATTTKQVALTNGDVTQIQQLQADLAETASQRDQRQTQLEAVQQSNQLTGQQQFYFDHLNQFSELAQLIPRLSLKVEQQAKQNEQLDTWTNAQQQILTRYGVDRLPQAPADNQIELLEQLQDQQKEIQTKLENIEQPQTRTQTTNTKTPWWSWAIAAVCLVIMFMVPNVIVKVILGIILLGSITSPIWLKQSQQQVDNSKQQAETQSIQSKLDAVANQLADWGRDNQMDQFDQSQWLSVQGDLRRFSDLEQQIELVNNEKAEINRQLLDFKQKLEFAHDWISTSDQSEILISRVEQFIQEQQNAKETWQKQQQKYEILTKQLQEIKQRQGEKEQQKAAIYARLQINNDADFKTTYQQSLQATVNQEKIAALTSQITADQQTELAQFDSVDDLKEQLNQLQGDVRADQQAIDDTFKRQTSIQLEIDQLAKNGTLSSLRQQQANLETTINQLVFDWFKEKLAATWINKALQFASADRFPKIIDKANNYFATLTRQHYDKIVVGDEVISVVDKSGQSFDVGELSQGTAEQLYVSLRFGFAVVMSDTVNLPLLIDDGFVNFDNLRKEAVFEIIKNISQENQVIYFTADDRILTEVDDEKVINLDKG